MNIYLIFVLGVSVGLCLAALLNAAKDLEKDAAELPVVQPEFSEPYVTREAQRVERPAYDRSVPGIVVREVDIDLAHKIVNAEPGSITYLRGARAE